MYTSDGIRLRAIENQISEQQRHSWTMLVVGLVVGFIGMYFFVARPMSRELRTMKVEVAQMQSQVQMLAAEGAQVWEANNLLAALRMQQTQLEEARIALQDVKQLREDVVTAADQARLGRDQLKAITELQNRLIMEQPSVEIAGRALDDISLLNERLCRGQETTQEAAVAFDKIRDLEDDLCAQDAWIADAETAVQRMIAMQEEIRRQHSGLDDAWASLHHLSVLKDTLLEGAKHVELAQIIADQLLDMQSKLAASGSDSEIAMNRANKLLELNETLSQSDLDVETSQVNLEALLQLNGKILTTPNIAEAIESLEILTSFQEEFIDQVQIIGEMRRSLVEIGLLETMVARTMRMIKPLVELGNLQRLSDAELRSAARNILDERTGRRAERIVREYEPTVKDAFVPEPTDGE